jgi:hypothetical protein
VANSGKDWEWGRLKAWRCGCRWRGMWCRHPPPPPNPTALPHPTPHCCPDTLAYVRDALVMWNDVLAVTSLRTDRCSSLAARRRLSCSLERDDERLEDSSSPPRTWREDEGKDPRRCWSGWSLGTAVPPEIAEPSKPPARVATDKVSA